MIRGVSVLSSSSAKVCQHRSLSSVKKNFAAQRSEYKGQLSELRKAWTEEFKQKQQLEEEQKKTERQRIILERAIKLREQRKQSQAKQEELVKAREEAFKRYKEKLAQTHLLWEEQQEITKSRRVRLEQDLSKETSAWITSVDQIDARITEDLFSKEAGSTGYATKYSNLWKYQVFTPKLQRLLSDDFQEKLQNSTSMMDRLKSKGQYRIAKRIVVEDFLDQIIGTGAERSDFKGLVSDLSTSFEKLEGFNEIKHFYEDDDSNANNHHHGNNNNHGNNSSNM